MDMDHIAPSEIKKLSWWEYEEYVKRLNDKIQRENKQNKESQKNQSITPDYSSKLPNMNSMMNIGNGRTIQFLANL